jgi:hypothetical protein
VAALASSTRMGTPLVVKGTTFVPRDAVGKTVHYKVRANLPRARWTKSVAITWTLSARNAVVANVAPVLTVSGSKVSWAAQKSATSYKGALSNASSGSSRTTVYQYLGTATSWSLTAQPGKTVYVGVASEGAAGERWSREVKISWPALNVVPVITVTNGKISWAAQAGATSFKGAATNSSGINYLSLGSVTSWSPTAEPGKTVRYAVASEGAAGEQW